MPDTATPNVAAPPEMRPDPLCAFILNGWTPEEIRKLLAGWTQEEIRALLEVR